MTTTIRAIELKEEDYIIGDRIYGAGTLDYTVQSVDVRYPAVEGQALVTIKVLTGMPSSQILRTIAYAGNEKVILGAAA